MKKHILCIGDSNTHGYCADPADCADGGIRFNEDERWTCLLQKALGPEYLVTEEGLSGRTTVFEDPINENMAVLPYVYALLKSHEYVDLLVIMLGTNDSKQRLNTTAYEVGRGMERLVRKAMTVDCWGRQEAQCTYHRSASHRQRRGNLCLRRGYGQGRGGDLSGAGKILCCRRRALRRAFPGCLLLPVQFR